MTSSPPRVATERAPVAVPRTQFEEPKSNEGQSNRCNELGALLSA